MVADIYSLFLPLEYTPLLKAKLPELFAIFLTFQVNEYDIDYRI